MIKITTNVNDLKCNSLICITYDAISFELNETSVRVMPVSYA